MLSLKLVRSLVLGDTINTSPPLNQNHQLHHDDTHHHHNNLDDDVVSHQTTRKKKGKLSINKMGTTPLLLFLPTRELIKDTYRLATIAREMGMDLNPTPSLSHIIFSWPSSPSSSSSSTTTLPSLWSSSSSTWTLSSDAVPLPFPSLTNASTTHLRCFVSLSKGLFKLVFYKSNTKPPTESTSTSNWNCSSLNLFGRVTGERIDNMESFSRVLTGMGWTLFKTKDNPSLVVNFSSNSPVSVYLFRKVDSSRVRVVQGSTNGAQPGELRIRELRLPSLDFRNAPLRILQYILLMTDNVFYLA